MREITYQNGFYTLENDGERDFRWMTNSAAITVHCDSADAWLHFSVGNAESHEVPLSLTGEKSLVFMVPPGWHAFSACLDDLRPGENGAIRLHCDNLHQAPEDGRTLSIMLGHISVGETPANNGALLQEGFYALEADHLMSFRWMRQKAVIRLMKAGPEDWLLFWVKSSSPWPEALRFTGPRSAEGHTIHILPGEWKVVGLPVALLGGSGDAVVLTTPYRLEHCEDARELAFMVADMRIGTPSAYEKNSALMHQEVFTTTQPESYGTQCTCDTSSECNLRCLVCVLDRTLRGQYENPAKGLEKTALITAQLVPLASKIQPYITGEPFFRKDIWQVLEQADAIRKERLVEVEVSTNALMLKGELLNKVLRSSISSLLVTVNAGTEKTYKRLCGGDFQSLKRNLIAMRESPLRKKTLLVSLSYVIMRENLEELPDFVRFAHEVGADAIQLWPMNSVAVCIPDKITRNGFEFCYKQQMPKYYPRLTRKMLGEALAMATELNVRVGVTPSYRLDDAGPEDLPYPLAKDAFERLALDFDRLSKELESTDGSKSCAIRKCYFPWNCIFYTTEGNFAPCPHLVYKGGIANILKEGIDGAWNGQPIQELRQNIMNGEVPDMCKDAQCPFII